MKQKNGFKTWYSISLAFQLGFLIVFPIAGFIFLGVLGDRFFKTSPLFLIVGMLSGLAITAYEGYHLLMPLIKGQYD